MRYGYVIDTGRCVGCDACTIACKHNNGTPPGVFFAQVIHEEKGEYPNAYMEYTPLLCMHCKNAPCVDNCPTGASLRDENGAVYVDADRCIGCRQCIAGCPYHARWYIASDPKGYYPEKGMTAKESAEFGEFGVGKVVKCTMCRERVAEGEMPSCVQTCPSDARVWGDLDDPDSEVSVLIHTMHAKPLAPEYGTEPSVYYI